MHGDARVSVGCKQQNLASPQKRRMCGKDVQTSGRARRLGKRKWNSEAGLQWLGVATWRVCNARPHEGHFSKHVSQFQDAHVRGTSSFITICGTKRTRKTTASVAQTVSKKHPNSISCIVCYEETHIEHITCDRHLLELFINGLNLPWRLVWAQQNGACAEISCPENMRRGALTHPALGRALLPTAELQPLQSVSAPEAGSSPGEQGSSGQ